MLFTESDSVLLIYDLHIKSHSNNLSEKQHAIRKNILNSKKDII